mgnify:CR=1 FL=1
MNILITGSDGQLGQEFKFLAGINTQHYFIFKNKEELDITSFLKLDEFFNRNKIDAIINCAAYTFVDKAEVDKDTAYYVNVIGPQNLAVLSKKYNIKLIHFSTDYVFNGENHIPYKEDDIPDPKSVYGKTKLQGENEIIKNSEIYAIIRTSWLYSIYGNNFVKTITKLAVERGDLKIIFDQIGTPTYASDLVNTVLYILPILNKENSGIYNYSNEGATSWYDFAKIICKLQNIQCRISPIETKDYPTLAQRPNYSVLNKKKIKTEFNMEIPQWQESLEKYMKENKKINYLKSI